MRNAAPRSCSSRAAPRTCPMRSLRVIMPTGSFISLTMGRCRSAMERNTFAAHKREAPRAHCEARAGRAW
jgi:hypothetical protein